MPCWPRTRSSAATPSPESCADGSPGGRRRTRLALLALIVAGAIGPAAATEPQPYLEELIGRARADRLAEHRAWLDLGHYRPDLLGSGWTSLSDSPAFFAAPRGKSDPAAELEATLAAFFAPPPADPDAAHPQCVYPARYRWLKARLEPDPARLPEQPCPELERW